MDRQILDIRSTTCPAGGALWAFLSHVCELKRGNAIELLTDDPQARTDLPEWARHMGWRILEQSSSGRELRFVVQRPWRSHVGAPKRPRRARVAS